MQDCHRGQVTSGNKWETVAKLTAHPQSNFWITNHKSPTENSPANNSHSYTATASIQRIISLEPKSKFPRCVARSLESSMFRALSARIECGTFALLCVSLFFCFCCCRAHWHRLWPTIVWDFDFLVSGNFHNAPDKWVARSRTGGQMGRWAILGF